MPQMKPIFWLNLYILFFLIIMIFMVMIFFNSLFLSLKNMKIYKNINKNLNWKW